MGSEQGLSLAQVLAHAIACHQRGNVADAERGYRRVLARDPRQFDALHLCGVCGYQQGKHAEALNLIAAAIRIKPGSAAAHSNLGMVLQAMDRCGDALASYDRALAIQPDFPEALNNRGHALQSINRHEEALADFDHALAIRPDYVDALNNRGNACYRLGRHEEAMASYDAVLARQPGYKYALGSAAYSRAHVCHWRDRDALEKRLVDGVRAGNLVCAPFIFLNVSHNPEDQLACAATVASAKIPTVHPPLWNGERYRHDRIRVAYLSADFHQHATAYLMAELFERHDRARFEITSVSFGPDQQNAMRARLMAAFDRFIDVRSLSDARAARLLHEAEIDIAVDLKGYTTDCRPGILARRPAPIQVNYLGYPGTMGTDYIDYVVADAFVIPETDRIHYSEKVVYLPDCYQVNDSKRRIGEHVPSRAEAGLPGRGFVFCCFNNSYKVTPRMFDIWMRLLARVEGSVLWLLQDTASAERNLRREAAARGIDGSRLVFAPRLDLQSHLARHRVADLFLDTLPYNAHTTASDALWAGLPVLTCAGTTFAGRVAGSLLRAVGLPELVAHTLDEYEARALRLATDPELLVRVKSKLAGNRLSMPLFDTDRFRRHIESAYRTMWEIHERGEAPRSFAV